MSFVEHEGFGEILREVPVRCRQVTGQREAVECGKCHVCGAPDSCLQHAAAPQIDTSSHAHIANADRLQQTTDPRRLHIHHTACTHGDALLGIDSRGDGLVEADRRGDELREPCVPAAIVFAEWLLDELQTEWVQCGESIGVGQRVRLVRIDLKGKTITEVFTHGTHGFDVVARFDLEFHAYVSLAYVLAHDIEQFAQRRLQTHRNPGRHPGTDSPESLGQRHAGKATLRIEHGCLHGGLRHAMARHGSEAFREIGCTHIARIQQRQQEPRDHLMGTVGVFRCVARRALGNALAPTLCIGSHHAYEEAVADRLGPGRRAERRDERQAEPVQFDSGDPHSRRVYPMYPGIHATERADQAAVVMASSGKALSYREFDARANRLAHLLRSEGLHRGDHYSIFMENHEWYLVACSAGERSGLYYTPANSHLTADEVGYIFENSVSQVVVTSMARLDTVMAALDAAPCVRLCLVADAHGPLPQHPGVRVLALDDALAAFPSTPIDDESTGAPMMYSSGTTGRPKGILKPLSRKPPALAISKFLRDLWLYREGLVYLSPAPLYHSAPQGATALTIRMGGTVVIMEKFDPEQFLALVERYRVTHVQMVPTMFSRLLKLPDEVRHRYDLSSLEVVVHAAAPCPIPVKEQMIAWWGPIIREYYGATEGMGFAACNSEEWLTHKGSVGRPVFGELHILDEMMQECPTGTPGTVWFKTATPFEYFNDPDKTRENTSPDGTMTTVGDVGYVDHDGYLYLTDRATFMIISGGVNIYPQETENLLITHPKVTDAAVFGVPNEDLGEEVKAVVQLSPGIDPGPDVAAELMEFCRANLSLQKCPRSIDFEAELPRTPTGKLFKRLLRDRYWGDRANRIV